MIPQLLLEQILCGEKNEKDYYKKYGREELQKALEELRKSNEEILSAFPSENQKNEINKKLMAEKNPEAKKSSVSKFTLIRYGLAALLAGAFIIPGALRLHKSAGYEKEVLASDSLIRSKGRAVHKIRLYRQKGSQAELLKNGDAAVENDLIQITYVPGPYDYGVIFSIDGKKNITRHYPEESWQAGKLEKTGEEVPLSFSYALDDAPDYECFVFAASKNPFDLSGIENLDPALIDLDFLKKESWLPEGCRTSYFMLKKK